jgi:glycolate oxidase FAD binding subunit
VDGVAARYVVEPQSVEEVSQVMRLAVLSGWAVTPRGAGTKLDLGSPPARVDLIVSTARMNRVLEHAAGDLIVRVEAGAPLAHLQEILASAGQRLALDPPELGGTIGGTIASGASGPLRLRYGTVRDLLIGITYVLPDGTVAKAGGKVVKNVAGYDLCKLFTGSLGTLGVIVEAIFRLHPLPPSRRTVTVTVQDPSSLGEVVQSVLRSELVPSAFVSAWDAGISALIVLFEGIEPGVAAQVDAAVARLKSYGVARAVDPREETIIWERLTSLPSPAPNRIGLKLSFPIAHLPAVQHEVVDLAREGGLLPRFIAQAGNGVARVDLSGGDDAGLIEFVETLRIRLERHAGSVIVRRASVGVKRQVDVWGPVGDAFPLMQRVKQRFDPQRSLNPGRFVGGI